MINFNKNKLINETPDRHYDTFAHTLDISDFVPEKFNKKIAKYIFKNMKKAFNRIDKEYRKYQREFNTKIKSKEKLLMEEKIKIKKFIKYRVKQIKEKTTNIKLVILF